MLLWCLLCRTMQRDPALSGAAEFPITAQSFKIIVLPSVLLCCMHEMPPPAPPPPHTMKDLSLAQAREDKEKHSEAMEQLLAVAHGKN